MTREADISGGGAELACRYLNWVLSQPSSSQPPSCNAIHQSDEFFFAPANTNTAAEPVDWECATAVPRGDVIVVPVVGNAWWHQDCCSNDTVQWPFTPPEKCGETPCDVTAANKCSFEDNKRALDIFYANQHVPSWMAVFRGKSTSASSFANSSSVRLASTDTACPFPVAPQGFCPNGPAPPDNTATDGDFFLLDSGAMQPGPYTTLLSFTYGGKTSLVEWRFRVENPAAAKSTKAPK